MTAGWRRWMRIFRRDPQADVDAELRFHMETRMDDLIAQGVPREDARAQALAEFGDVDTTRAALGAIDRRMAGRHRRAGWWEAVAQDARHAVRGLLRSPGYTVMVAVTLALGIGANAAVFSLMNRLFLRVPDGVQNPTQLRRLIVTQRFAGQPADYTRSVFNFPEFRGVARNAPAGVTVGGFVPDIQPFGAGADAPQRPVEYAVGPYLRVLGLHPAVGRFFSDAEQSVSAFTPVVVISHRLWLRQFGGSANVLGQSLELGTHHYTIIGVAPRGFAGMGLDQVDAWLPFNLMGGWTARRPNWYESTGTLMVRGVSRLNGNVTDPQAVAAATQGIRASGVTWDSTASAMLQPVRGAGAPDLYVRENAIAVRLAAVALIILLIACANVINLGLNREQTRQHETAVRLALGVSRARLMLHTLSESIIVALASGAAAALVAVWASLALARLLLPSVAWGGATLDATLIWFVVAVSIGVGIVVGLILALRGSSPASLRALQSDSRGGGGGRGRSKLRNALVIVQVGLSLVLLTGSGLFVRSLQQVHAIDIGYDVKNVLFVSPSAREDTAAARAIRVALPQLSERLAAVPGVAHSALTFMPPIWGLSWIDTFLPDRDSLPGASTGAAPMVLLGSPGFLQALGVHVIAGRGFTSADRKGAEPVLVVNQALAQLYWPGQDALGKCLILHARSEPCRRIVGVTANAHMTGLIETPGPAYFVPIDQDSSHRASTIVLRSAPGELPQVRARVAAVLRDALGANVKPGLTSMDDIIGPAMRQWQTGAMLFSIAGLLALIVAAVGVYSTVSYGMTQRVREFGIRVALGARPGQIVRLVLTGGLRTVLVGVVAGVCAALLLGRLVKSLLYGVPPWDPWVLMLSAAVLLGVAAAACLVPARRAERLDPTETLRAE